MSTHKLMVSIAALAAAIAVVPSAHGNLLVGSFDNDSVLSFDRTTGEFIAAFDTAGVSGLSRPRGVTVGADGNVYVSNGNSSVLRFDLAGDFLDTFVSPGSGGLNTAHGLTFGPDDNLYVASFTSAEILRYDGSTGAFIDQFNNGGLLAPNGLPRAIVFGGPDGDLYGSVLGNRVIYWDGTTGDSKGYFVQTGSGGLNGEGDLTFGPDGNDDGVEDLYLASQFSDQVLRYDGITGAFIDVFISAGAGGVSTPYGLAFGPDDNLYVTSYDTDQVLRYDGATGEFIDVFASGNGLDGPMYLTFVPDPEIPEPGMVLLMMMGCVVLSWPMRRR